MANDLNLCQFIGRLGADPEARQTQGGTAVTNFNIACGEKFKDQSGAVQERTTWVRIVAWGKLAEICSQYLRKGSQVYVSGRFSERKWQDQNGNDRYTVEIVADKMQMLGSKQDGGQQGQAQGAAPAQGGYAQRGSQGQGQRRPDPQAPPAGGYADLDEDIPFARKSWQEVV